MRFENVFIQMEIACVDAKTWIPIPEVNLEEQTIFTAKPGSPRLARIALRHCRVKRNRKAGQVMHVRRARVQCLHCGRWVML